jgi:hypothetical protein
MRNNILVSLVLALTASASAGAIETEAPQARIQTLPPELPQARPLELQLLSGSASLSTLVVPETVVESPELTIAPEAGAQPLVPAQGLAAFERATPAQPGFQAAARGAAVRFRELLGFFGTPPQAPSEGRPSSGGALRDFIWDQRILPSAYAAPPESNGGWRNNLNALRAFATLGKTFDHDGDALPPSRDGFKLFHPFGSVLKIQYQSREGHPFTGLLAGRDVPGLMRLSLGAPEKTGTFIPGTAIKLFIEGHASANAVFLGERTGVDGQQPDKNFFAESFTNDLPNPRSLVTKIAGFIIGLFNRGNALFIPVDQFGRRDADGTPAAPALAPYKLVLKPAPGLGNASDTKKGFRENLADLPIGRIFEVYAAQGPNAPLIHVGDIDAVSKPVASEYGDKGLFFRHSRGQPAAAAKP